MIEAGSRVFWRATLALCLGSFMIFSNVYVTQPLLPMIASYFKLSTLQASWSFTLSTLTLGLSLLLYGPLSDALGRRRLMQISMLGVTLLTFSLFWAEYYPSLLCLRALQGLCLGGLPAIAIAYMADEFSPAALRVAVGFYIAANTLGGISGRLIGGFAGDWLGWQAAFMIMGLVSVISLSLFTWLLPPSQGFQAHPLKPAQMSKDMFGHLRNPELLVAYLIGGGNFMIFITQYSYISFVLSEAPYHLPARFIGLLFLTYLSGTLASMLSGRITQSLRQPIAIGLGISLLAGGSLLSLTGDLIAIICGFLINAFGFFLAHSVLSSWVSLHAPHARASASSLYLVLYYLGASIGGFYLEPFWRWGHWSGVIIGSLIMLSLTFTGTLYLNRRDKYHLSCIAK